ncbi:hypothetical protein GUJ93_ZPchr0007g4858 [Zizania palustris]|uniref:Uncharacterized protein n=1 Tax=Zizania palustris TaxID=103762 RepID=A0A8J5SSJ2_ZIZPA|nr:hypothetical protein GUJ93_ZPchr0007g4858 [Zizania palustris]
MPTPSWSAPSLPRTSSPLHAVRCIGFVARNRRRGSLLQICAADHMMYAADHHGMCASARASDCDDRFDDVDR